MPCFTAELVKRVAELDRPAAGFFVMGVLNTDNRSMKVFSDYGPYALFLPHDRQFTAAYFDYLHATVKVNNHLSVS